MRRCRLSVFRRCAILVGMQVEIENRQGRGKYSRKGLAALARRLAELSGAEAFETTLILVDSEGIAPINAAAVGHTGPTDVITLSYGAIPGEGGGASAEIVLNVQFALEQNPEDPSRELAYYLAHAFDHLSGRDDDTPARRTAMHRRERRWLAASAAEVAALDLRPSFL